PSHRHAGRLRVDSVPGDDAPDDSGVARLDRSALRAPRSVNGESRRTDGGPAIPAQRADSRGDPDVVFGSRRGAAARSHGQTAGRAGDRRASRRYRWIEMDDGVARARAACASRLCDRALEWRQEDDFRVSRRALTNRYLVNE